MISKNPTSIIIDNKHHKIRYDMWSILDILKCFNDPELSREEQFIISLEIFYLDTSEIINIEEAIKQMNWFINLGDEVKENNKSKSSPKLMDWEQDFNIIKAPVNRILGYDIGMKRIHWWTFMSAYMEIFSNENNLFCNVINIRKKISKGKRLEPHERKFYNENRDIIDLKVKLTPEEMKQAKELFGEV